MSIPQFSKYVIIGAGIHGLSTAFHLAQSLKAARKGSGEDIIVIDKSGIASGASGIACGVVRNNYYQPAMRELMAHSVNVWETDPETYAYHPVGYMQISCQSMHDDVGSIYEQQKAIGYESDFIEGNADCAAYMKDIYSDWQARVISHRYSTKNEGVMLIIQNRCLGSLQKLKPRGVRIMSGIDVKGFRRANGASSAITAVKTDKGDIDCDYVVIGAGPWVRDFWSMLDLPKTVSIKGKDGVTHDGIGMWTFWQLEEVCPQCRSGHV